MNILEKLKINRAILYLKNLNPQKFEAYSQKRAIRAFHHVYRNSKAYKRIIQNKEIIPSNVRTINDFKTLVPIINKEEIFTSNNIEDIMSYGSFKDVHIITTSSGFSGKLAFGLDNKKNQKKIERNINLVFEKLYHISQRKTLLINTLAMGVHIPTSLPLIETSVRSDIVLKVLKKFCPKYEQTIIVGDPHFIKKLAEEGTNEKIPWNTWQINFISGQDWFSETFRDYIAHLTQINLNSDTGRSIIATMGTSELGLNIFHETSDTLKIRRELEHNKAFRAHIYSAGPLASPLIMQYYPTQYYLEEISIDDTPTLVFTSLANKSYIQLIRYITGDQGKIYSYMNFAEILKEFELNEYIPDLKLPIGLIFGRKSHKVQNKETVIFIEDIKQGMYKSFNTAHATTGYFKVSFQNGLPLIAIQLNPSIKPTKDLIQSYYDSLESCIPDNTQIKLYPYENFPYGMELSYEKKFSFV